MEGIMWRTSSAVKAARQSWMLAGFVLAVNQLLMPPLLSFTSGRLRPRNTSYLHSCLRRAQCMRHLQPAMGNARRHYTASELPSLQHAYSGRMAHADVRFADQQSPANLPNCNLTRQARPHRLLSVVLLSVNSERLPDSGCTTNARADKDILGEAGLALVAHDVALQLAPKQLRHRRLVARQIARPQTVRLRESTRTAPVSFVA